MIVSTYFKGDGSCDSHVQWLQHDVYHEALGIITGTCQEQMRIAHALLEDWEWEFIESYDHRTMQDVHDVLAAVWRFRYEIEIRQFELPFERPNSKEPNFVGHWLRWLREEVESWTHYPERIRLVVKILRNQNQPEGYQAETALYWNIIEACSDVPWKQGMLYAAKSALKSD